MCDIWLNVAQPHGRLIRWDVRNNEMTRGFGELEGRIRAAEQKVECDRSISRNMTVIRTWFSGVIP